MKLWDAKTGTEVLSLKFTKGYVYRVCINPDGRPSSLAPEYESRDVVVEMTIVWPRVTGSGKHLQLWSQPKAHDQNNFSAFPQREQHKQFLKREGIENPNQLKRRTIRFVGRVELHLGCPQIIIQDLRQIKLLDKSQGQVKPKANP